MQNFILIEETFTFIWDWTILYLVIQILNNFLEEIDLFINEHVPKKLFQIISQT